MVARGATNKTSATTTAFRMRITIHRIELRLQERTMIKRQTAAVVIACAALVYAGTLIQAQAPTVKRTVLLQHDTSAPGYEAVLVAVEIPVGGREGRHTHSGTAM